MRRRNVALLTSMLRVYDAGVDGAWETGDGLAVEEESQHNASYCKVAYLHTKREAIIQRVMGTQKSACAQRSA